MRAQLLCNSDKAPLCPHLVLEHPQSLVGAVARRREYDRELSKLLEEIPRATSAPPHLQDRWGGLGVSEVCMRVR